MSEPAEMALYATHGPRREKGQHVVVLYLRVNKDWTSRNLSRNGNYGPALARCAMTAEAEVYCAGSNRASSLQYSGSGAATLQGLEDDLRSFGLEAETVARFVEAARKEGLH